MLLRPAERLHSKFWPWSECTISGIPNVVNRFTSSVVILAAVWSGQGLGSTHSNGKIVLDYKEISVVFIVWHWNLQDVHCYHLPRSSNWHIHHLHSHWHGRLCLLANSTFLTMTFHHYNGVHSLVRCPTKSKRHLGEFVCPHSRTW